MLVTKSWDGAPAGTWEVEAGGSTCDIDLHQRKKLWPGFKNSNSRRPVPTTPVRHSMVRNRQQGTTSTLSPPLHCHRQTPSLYPLSEWPAWVHVIILPSPVREQLGFSHQLLQTRHLKYWSLLAIGQSSVPAPQSTQGLHRCML